MNKERRDRLDRAVGLLSEARGLIEDVEIGEQDAFDAMPESLQTGERGDRMQEVIYALREAVAAIEGVETELEECKS